MATVIGGMKDNLDPLSELYQLIGREKADLTFLSADDMPEPEKSLLVHDDDMTGTLRRFFKDDIVVEALRVESRHGQYFREVILWTRDGRKRVTYGAIQIKLELLPLEMQKEILKGEKPFGGLLQDYEIGYRSAPCGFFCLEADNSLIEGLALQEPENVFGRVNQIFDKQGQLLVNVVEILPPLHRYGEIP